MTDIMPHIPLQQILRGACYEQTCSKSLIASYELSILLIFLSFNSHALGREMM